MQLLVTGSHIFHNDSIIYHFAWLSIWSLQSSYFWKIAQIDTFKVYKVFSV